MPNNAFGCCNLIVADCTPHLPTLISGGEIGSTVATFSALNLFNEGFRQIYFVGINAPMILTGNTGNPGEYTTAPNAVNYPPGLIQSYTDCWVGTTHYQTCKFYKAGVGTTAGPFTYRGDLGASESKINGFWVGLALPNGLYPAWLKTDGAGDPDIRERGWIRGSVRIVPVASSRLRWSGFGNKLRGVFSTDRLTDATVTEDSYLNELLLPPGI